ncbi:MAG: HlyD family efflux transporter periplasmic adaptor subunit [Proteobacteria bacterium]|nr:HlyD family efflux transporter periplasmic adaptor subunit [Pseudomonadota bacterium]MBK8960554.1 HlyD family efflux transporter periplasmic adaptor subunit [Pseudomonadota bacterium]
MAAPASTPIPRGKRKPLLVLLLLSCLAAAAGGGAYYWWVARFFEHTDDAYVAANVVEVTPQVTGTVVAVTVRDTDRVTAGQLLVELDPADTEIALQQAEAELARTLRQVRTVYAANETLAADIAVRRAELKRALTDADKAQGDLDTRAALVKSGAVGKEELKHAQAALATAEAVRNAASAAIAAAEERLSANQAMTEGVALEEHPEVQRAAARVREAYLAWARTRILAPVDGDIAKRAVQVGQRVQPGSNLLSVVPLEHVWVDANFKEVQLGDMRIGQPVTMHADMYGDTVEYHGQVVGFGAGTGSAFALLPAQNATGNWIKIVQRVPVRIELDSEQTKAHPLRVGLSMQVQVEVRDTGGPRLREVAASDAERSRTHIFEDMTKAADLRIADIIARNSGKLRGDGVAARP